MILEVIKTRIDALDKVLGSPVFAGDKEIDGALYAVIYRSPRPHASIRGIDVKGVLSLPGIVRVIGSADIPVRNYLAPSKRISPVSAQDRVRYVGEPILVIVGETEEVARKALRLVRFEFEDIEGSMTPSWLRIINPIHEHR